MMDLLELLRHDPDASRADAVDKSDCIAFDGWSDRDLGAIAALGRHESIAAGATLIEADRADDRDLFIVVDGQLEAYRVVGGHERRVVVLKSGDLIGEMAFIDGRPRSASVRALTAAAVLRIRAADVQVLCRTDPALGLKLVWEIVKVLSARVRRVTTTI